MWTVTNSIKRDEDGIFSRPINRTNTSICGCQLQYSIRSMEWSSKLSGLALDCTRLIDEHGLQLDTCDSWPDGHAGIFAAFEPLDIVELVPRHLTSLLSDQPCSHPGLLHNKYEDDSMQLQWVVWHHVHTANERAIFEWTSVSWSCKQTGHRGVCGPSSFCLFRLS